MIKSGFLNILKPTGMTSFEVVSKVKKMLGTKKVGHQGTLDPAASGVLPIAVGSATKYFNYFLNKDKIYVARVKFGVLTDTLDSFGEVIEKKDAEVSKEKILSVLPNFLGKIMQVPPKYSAIKIGGKKAYELARENKDFEIKPREVEVFDIKLLENVANNEFLFCVHCSAGTYIRSLFNDIATVLGTIATISVIIRKKSGEFFIEEAKLLDEISENDIISVDDLLSNKKRVELSENLAKKFINGNFKQISDSDLKELINIKNEEFFAYFDGKLIGLFERKDNKISQIVYGFEE